MSSKAPVEPDGRQSAKRSNKFPH